MNRFKCLLLISSSLWLLSGCESSKTNMLERAQVEQQYAAHLALQKQCHESRVLIADLRSNSENRAYLLKPGVRCA